MTPSNIRIIGIDPGETSGWALVEIDGAGDADVLDHGVIAAAGEPPSEAEILTTTRRFLTAMLDVMEADGVNRVAIEAPAYNQKQNRFADEVRGVCKEAVAAAGLGWYLIPHQTAKAAVGVKAARGKKGEPRPPRDAVKKAVKDAVEARFELTDLSYHEADAVACALAFAALAGREEVESGE